MADLPKEGIVMIKTILSIIGILLGILLVCLCIALVRTLLTPAKVSEYKAPEADERAMDYAKKLSAMVQCDTTSHDSVVDYERFAKFHRVLEELFPLVHEKLERTDIDGNLLYYWKGESSEKPIVLMSHQDVVPAEGEWIHEPFSGDIADGKVWGRGTSDTKCSVFGFFQAVEELLAEGVTPPQDIYLSSSCTEEWAGDGCPKLVAELKRRGVTPFLVCDEGGGIITDPVGGIHGNFAMVGVFEKGKADLRFTARSNGGHASAPKAGSPIARIAAFVNEMETKDPFRRRVLPEGQ
jgi:carboxypeptidase PM20D1